MARSFNGSSDLINCDSATGALDITGNITIAAWVYPTTLPTLANTWFCIVEKGYDGTNEQYSLAFQKDQNTAAAPGLFWGQNIVGPFAFWNYGTSITTNNWYHVAGTWNGTSAIVYASGVSRGTATNSNGPTHTAEPVKIGAATIISGSSRFFAGRIAEVGIWNVALTANEILALASGIRCNTIRPLNLAGYYPLDGIASPEIDLSGFANNGALTGTSPANGPPITMFTPRWQLELLTGAVPSTIFRRSASSVGTRTGTRQIWAV